MKDGDKFGELTSREVEVLILLCDGLSNKQIANNLVIVECTVEFHLKNIYQKLDVTRRSQAIAKVLKMNWLNRVNRSQG
jgi:ATP/maltotriose-dependent transcriptional regulator MalT